MIRFKNLYLFAAFSAMILGGFSSCSSDDDDIIINNNGETTEEEVTETLNKISTEWGLSKKAINDHMKGYVSVENKDTTVLQFNAKKSPITIVYQFANDKLSAAAIKAKVGEGGIDVKETLAGFTYIGESSSNDIYTNEVKNVFAVSYTATEEDDNFQIIGFTPLKQMLESKGGKEYADLGLSAKWANYNVGASKPEEYGSYFAWGETTEKDSYSWKTYSHCEGSSSTCVVLGDSICGTQYDAAYVNWGSNWQTPTKKQMDELRTKCSWVWTTLNGVNGYKVFGKNGNYIFLPAAGYKTTSLRNGGSYGYYMTSTPYTTKSQNYFLNYTSSSRKTDYSYRYYGYSVRAVLRNN